MNRPLAIVFLLLFATPCFADTATAPAPVITLGRDTTFVTEPLKPDGTVDYVSALDALQKKGATVENNMVIPLLRAIGTDHFMLSDANQKAILKRLGMAEQPDKRTFQRDLGRKLSDELWYELDQVRQAPWKPGDHPQIAKWLAADKEAIDLYIEASKRSRYYVPIVSKTGRLLDADLPAFNAIRGLASLVAARAMMKLEAGDIEGCVADLSAIHRIGRLIQQGAHPFEYLTGCGIDSVASRCDAVLIASGKLTAKAARDYLAAQASWPVPKEPYESFDLMERMTLLDIATQLRVDGMGKFLTAEDKKQMGPAMRKRFEDLKTMDFSPMLRDINKVYDDTVAAAREPDARKRQEALALIEKTIEDTSNSRSELLDDVQEGKPPAMQKLLSNMVLMSFRTPMGAFVKVTLRPHQQSDLARIGLALVAYRADKGAYPDSLNTLAPDYLKEIPKDRFTLEPLKYQRKANGFLLYSVGDDLKDDNGEPIKSGKGDIVLQSER